MTDTRIQDLVAKKSKDGFVVRYDDEKYDKIIKGQNGNKVYDWKQKDFDIKMNDEEPILGTKTKIVGKGHKHYFKDIFEAEKYHKRLYSRIYKMKKWNDGIELYDSLASETYKKKLKDLESLFSEENLYCYDRLYLGKAGDIPYMQREYFKRATVNTIPSVGCLITCIAEIVSYYFDIWKTPKAVDEELDEMDFNARFDWERGYIKNSANLNTKYVVENKYGLVYNEPKDNTAKDNTAGDYKDIFRKELDKRVKANEPTIILLKKGKMHFVVVVGIRYKGKDESGKPTHYIINDPGASSSKEEVRYISRDTLKSEYWDRDITKIYPIDKR
ncbi:MAG: C39 family peptidase [Spirochaetes bacterium]|nr:C39 family peptidase [Spirochaetota bacterium]